jgi:hypothetical protein
MYVVQVDTVERQSLLATRNNWVMGDLLSIVDFCPLMCGLCGDGTGIVDFVGRVREKRQADFFLDRGDTASGRTHAFAIRKGSRCCCVGMNSCLFSVVGQKSKWSQSRSRTYNPLAALDNGEIQAQSQSAVPGRVGLLLPGLPACFSLQAPTSFT